MNRTFWRGRRVLMTGHTGFKGGWLTLWLERLGAEVHGLALAPPTTPSFHDACDLDRHLASSLRGDITDLSVVNDAMRRARPEIVFHLAAQPLVRRSYHQPLETFRVNVIGTAHVLEAARQTPGVRAIVNVTTDKCYENREWVWPYREDDPMGGADPYSASKGCAELVSAAYRKSFLAPAGIQLATARAGNVIGGGDWAEDRLLPDVFRAVDAGRPVPIRSPHAVRPWQHVLDPLAGYLLLAERLNTSVDNVAGAWNFGPGDEARPVSWIADRVCTMVPGASWQQDKSPTLHEAHALRLDSSKARALLGWRPRWTLEQALDRTISWHQAWRRGADMHAITSEQIAAYESAQAQ